MGTTALLLLLGLLVGPNWGVPIHGKDERHIEWHAESFVANSMSDKQRSIWNIKGDLTIQPNEGFSVLKLDNLKTGLYNGHQTGEDDEFPSPEMKPLPTEAHMLAEPWIFYYPPNPMIRVMDTDPNWSTNMKRGIMNVLWHKDLTTLPEGESVLQEELMYGRCNVTYSKKSEGTNIKVKKTISIKDCEDGEVLSYYSNTNVWDCSAWTQDQIQRKISRTYFMEDGQLVKVKANSEIDFQVTPQDPHHQHIKQTQTFILKNKGPKTSPIDYSKLTSKKEFKFEHGDRPMDGRIVKKTLSTEQLVEQMLAKLTEMKKAVNAKTSENSEQISESIDKMWMSANQQTEKSLELVMKQIKDDKDMRGMFMTMLPYLGTNSTIKFLHNFIQTDVNEFELYRILNHFPRYANEYSKDLVDTTREAFKNIKLHVDKLKYNTELSFGTLVLETYKQNKITEKEYKGYIEEYFQLFRGTKDRFKKLMYLLALNNMKLPMDKLKLIVKDKDEIDHLRIIAMKAMTYDNVDDVDSYKSLFIPILMSETETLELRVMALRKLLEFVLDPKDFKEVYEYLNEETENPNMQHLYNYLYTSLASNIEQTKCSTPVHENAEEYFDKMEEPESETSWITGDYTVAYTNDMETPDFGSRIRVSLIGDPTSGAVEVIDLDIGRSALGLHKELSIHLRFSGFIDAYLKKYFKQQKTLKNIQDYIDLIKKHSLHLLNQKDFSMDIVLFTEDPNNSKRAIFAVHLDEELMKKTKNKNPSDAKKDIINMLNSMSTMIGYPTVDNQHIPSDMGTDLTLNIDEEIITHMDFINIEKTPSEEENAFKYGISRRWYAGIAKSMDLWNPVAGIRQGAFYIHFKNNYWQILFDLVKSMDMIVQMDSRDLQWERDSLIVPGVYAYDPTVLKVYCETCKIIDKYVPNTEVQRIQKSFPMGDLKYEAQLESTGVQHAATYYKGLMGQVMKNKLTRTRAFPMGELWACLDYFLMHEDYIPKWDTYHSREKILFKFEEPVHIQFSMHGASKDISSSTEVLPGSETSFGLDLFVRTIKDDKLIRKAVFKGRMHEEPGLLNQSLGLSVAVMKNDDHAKACLDVKFRFPEMAPDYYSLTPADPTYMELDLKAFELKPEEYKDCTADTPYRLDVKGIFSVTDEQMETAAKATYGPFQKCKKESAGLKYTAPTSSCKKAHEEMSTYRRYDMEYTLNESGMKKLESADSPVRNEVQSVPRRMNFTVTFPRDKPIEALVNGVIDEKFGITANRDQLKTLKEALINSKDFTDDMDDSLLEIGSKSTCILTNKFISTFLNHTISEYKHKPNVELIGLMECREAKEGVTFTPLDDRHMGLNVWIADTHVTAVPKGNGLSVMVDDEPLVYPKFMNTQYTKVYFLSEDAIYIKGPIMQVYYNTEYVRIEVYTAYAAKVCGLCSDEKQHYEVHH